MATFLVIGGSSGIGKAVVDQLVQQGHHVHATYHKRLIEDKEGVQYHNMDVTSETIDFSFIPDIVDGVVYCPGSINLKPFHRIDLDSLQADYDLQIKGIFKVLQACHKALRKSTQASVVFFSTVAVQTGFNYHSQVASTKGAIEGLTRALAAEYAPNIRFNAVAPSITDTPLAESLLSTEEKRENNAKRHPLHKIGTAEDIAQMVCFLLLPSSSWITGQILKVDGGISSIR